MNKQQEDPEFWNTWKRCSTIETHAIQATKRARSFVVQSLPKGKLIAIYIKGSFARREMKRGSDVDMVPIVASDKFSGPVWEVNERKVKPVVVVPLSLSELRKNKLSSRARHNPDLRAKPDRFLHHLSQSQIIFGKPIDPKKFPIRTDEVALRDEKSIIKNGYIPAFQKNKISFVTLLKEVFWLVELEQLVAGKHPAHSFVGIAKSESQRNHLIHTALRFRKREAGRKKQRLFILDLQKYLRTQREIR